MKIRLHNNNSTDYVDYEGTLEEIYEQSAVRITLPQWKNGWSEVLEK